MFSKEYQEKNRERFYRRMERLGAFGEELCKKAASYEGDVRDGLHVLYGRMPVSDMANYPIEVFADFAEQGAKLWREGAFAGQIPEEIFASYVLFHRVNDEEIEPCRSFFGEKMEKLLTDLHKKEAANKALRLAEAALAVNYWCAGEVSYHQEDDRTASAMSVYRAGEGRCGEESAFVVNVLRSAGIPARQVYAPYWSHCDDNHAWVEVWCDGTWHYLGACEPEEVLDQGWFDGASSRAMMIHTPLFGAEACQQRKYSEENASEESCSDKLAGTKGCAVLLPELRRYADTVPLHIKIVTEDGHPAANAKLCCMVMNYAAFLEIANGCTDESGAWTLETGRGTLLVSAASGDRYGEMLMNLQEASEHTIQICREPWRFGQWEEAECLAPACRQVGEKVPANEEKLMTASRHLQEKREQFAEGQCEKEADIEASSLAARLVEILPEKDRREVSAEFLKRQAASVKDYAAQYPEDIFVPYLLNPRISLERLTCHGEALRDCFRKDEREQFLAHPETVYAYVESRVKLCPEEEYRELITEPAQCLKAGRGNRTSREVLKAAILRSVGIPARLSPIDGAAEYYEADGSFRRLEERRMGTLRLEHVSGEPWTYRTDYSVALYRDGRFQVCQSFPLGEAVEVPEGIYRICTANRLPNGNVFAKIRYERVEANASVSLVLEKKEAKLSEMLSEVRLPEISLKTRVGEAFQASEHPGIYIWAEPGKEPTEHIFNELIALSEGFRETPVYVIAEEMYSGQQTYKTLQEHLPKIHCLTDEDSTQAGRLARSMFREPGLYPFILVLGQDLTGIYAEAGYNVGTADMLLRIIQAGLV